MPVSIFPIVAKIFEKLICGLLTKYLFFHDTRAQGNLKNNLFYFLNLFLSRINYGCDATVYMSLLFKAISISAVKTIYTRRYPILMTPRQVLYSNVIYYIFKIDM